MDNDELLGDLERLQALLITESGGSFMDDGIYRPLRRKLMRNPRIGNRIPAFVRDHRDREQVWAFLKERWPDDPDARRRFIWDALRPVIDELEFEGTPVERQASELLRKLDRDSVVSAWDRALARRREDPEGAITAARSLLESVCKHILDDANIPYSAQTDLPKLYRMTAENS